MTETSAELERADDSARGTRDRGPAIVAALALAWLAATLWSANATIAGTPASVALAQAALVLPGIIAASLVAGGGAGLVAVGLLGRRFPAVEGRLAVRLGVAAAAGLVVGAMCTTLIVIGYGTTSAVAVLASAVGVAAILGGTLGGAPQSPVVGAVFAGTLAWFVVGLFQGAFYGRLLHVFGAGDTVASLSRATSWLSFTVAVVGGLVAGLVAYRYLRRRDCGWRWPAYLVAGAGPGLLILLADVITRVGGAQLLGVAGSVSADDRAAISYLGATRLTTAEFVLFIGALTAVVAFGRTLKSPAR